MRQETPPKGGYKKKETNNGGIRKEGKKERN